MTKLVIIHPLLYNSPKSTVLLQSFTSDVIPIYYDITVTKQKLLTLIGENISSISHIAFMYHYPGHNVLPFFNDVLNFTDAGSHCVGET